MPLGRFWVYFGVALQASIPFISEGASGGRQMDGGCARPRPRRSFGQTSVCAVPVVL